MIILGYIIQIMSGAILLLCAVRMLRSGIERQFGAWVQGQFAGNRHVVSLLSRGACLAFAMQGGTLVVLMSASFAARNLVPAGAAMVVALGAEFGSALAVNVLHTSSSSLGPIFLLIGGWCFLHISDTQKAHNVGRILLGLGLVFLALDVIRLAVAPLQTSEGVLASFAALGTDPVNAAILGLILAFVMHSSLVAMLTAATFAANGDLTATSALGFMLGCNMGSALLPIWLMRGEPREALQVAQAVGTLRVGLAAVLLAGLALAPSIGLLFASANAVQAMLYGHLAFNFALWLLAPLLRPLAKHLFLQNADDSDTGTLPTSELAPAAFKREVNKMLDTLSAMLHAATADTPNVALVADLEETMNSTLTSIRQSYADLPAIDDTTDQQINSFLDYAIRIERSADLLAGKYMNIRHEEQSGMFQLPENGRAELTAQVAELQSAMILAQHVFWKEDPSEARQLIKRKERMTLLEQDHKRRHFSRLKSQDPNELASSNQYLEMIAALKEVTSKLATIGYVVLDRHGGLKRTRLKAKST